MLSRVPQPIMSRLSAQRKGQLVRVASNWQAVYNEIPLFHDLQYSLAQKQAQHNTAKMEDLYDNFDETDRESDN